MGIHCKFHNCITLHFMSTHLKKKKTKFLFSFYIKGILHQVIIITQIGETYIKQGKILMHNTLSLKCSTLLLL